LFAYVLGQKFPKTWILIKTVGHHFLTNKTLASCFHQA